MSTDLATGPDLFAPVEAPDDQVHTTPIIQVFVAFLLLCQVALLFRESAPVRLPIRVAAFGGSMALLLLVRGRARKRHPAHTLAVLTLGVIFLAVFNPGTTNLVAGAAQAVLYTAVMAPLFWVPRMRLDTRVLRQTALILWGFHTCSAALGVLQVYFPGSLQPPVSAIVASKGKGYLESLMIITASGQKVFRPMGLTDVPGGASISGLYAVLFGTGFFLTRRNVWMMAATALSMVIGMTALYLSQVRAVLVMTGIAVTVVAAILVWRRDVPRLGTLGAVAAAMFMGGYVLAMSLAGPSVATRVASLSADRPAAVYYHERGHFFADAVTNLLPEDPFGRGLGHWGMMATYFGGDTDPSRAVWVEIQWAGWIVDGGAPLAVLYCSTLVAAIWMAWKVARSRAPEGSPDLPFWGAVVLAHGIGALALTFSYPIFLSQPGMEFWLLNATLFAAARHARARARLLAEAREAAAGGAGVEAAA